MSTTTSLPRVDPTLSALPPALKKRIIKALEEIDEDSHGDCGSCCGSEEGDGDHDLDHVHSHKHKGALGDFEEVEAELDELAKPVQDMLRNVGNLSLVNKEFFKLCSNFIWQSPDIVERSTESLLYFYHNILPRHAEHIESLFLMQTVERLVEEEDSKFKVVSGSTEEEREAAVLEAVESIAKVSASNKEEVRTARSRSLVVGEIIKSCPKLYKLDFDCFVMEPLQKPHRDLKDYVLEAAKSHAKSHGSITYLGYSLTPDAVTTYEDVASLLSSYSSILKSLRIECFSAKGNKQTFLDSLLSLQQLEKLDLGESDFVDDSFADLSLTFPLTHLTLGEYDNLSYPSFTKLVEKFSHTLVNLELDGSPYAGSEEEELEKASKDLKNPVKLPNLTLLEIATNHKVEVLDKLAYSASKLKELRIGFCPNFNIDETIHFIEKRRDTLESLEVDLATYSHEELSKLDAVCEELGVTLHVISGGLDDFGLGDDFDEDEEWEDDEDEEDEDVHAMD